MRMTSKGSYEELEKIKEKLRIAESKIDAAEKKYTKYDDLLEAGNLTPVEKAEYEKERAEAKDKLRLALEDRNALLAHYDKEKASLTGRSTSNHHTRKLTVQRSRNHERTSEARQAGFARRRAIRLCRGGDEFG